MTTIPEDYMTDGPWAVANGGALVPSVPDVQPVQSVPDVQAVPKLSQRELARRVERHVPTDRAERIAQWGDGPWIDETDRAEWQQDGLACLVRRIPFGSLCGYVALPPSHPLFGASYDMAHERGIRAHGGLTYSEPCSGDVCHVPAPGETDHVWWFGFDTAHAFDFSPGLYHLTSTYSERSRKFAAELRAQVDAPEDPSNPHQTRYRDLAYVTRETNELAEQLAKVDGWKTYRARLEAARTPRERRRAEMFAGLTRKLVRKRDHRRAEANAERRWLRGVARELRAREMRAEQQARRQASLQLTDAQRASVRQHFDNVLEHQRAERAGEL